MTPANACGSMPNFTPSAIPSATAAIEIPKIRLLQILAIWPAPTSPQ